MIRRDAAGPVLGWVLALVLACAVTAGCGLTSDGPPSSGGPATSGGEPAAATTSPSALSTHAASRSSKQSQPRSCPARVFARMTMAQRVGQLFLVGIAGDPGAGSARALTAYHFGSLLFGTTTTAGLAAVGQLARADQAQASARATAGVRFFIAADQEGGLVQRLRGPGFSAIPPALIQGELSSGVLQQEAAAWGRELRSAGVNLDLAPVMDVVPPGTADQNQPIGVLQREFGDNPQTVAAHGVAFIRGMRQAGVATTAKHFPGLGRVRGNTDFTSGVVDAVTGPSDPYLGSFRGAIDAGVPFVMVALASYPRIDPRHLAVFSPRVMQTILRREMRFRGVIVSDDMAAAQAVAGLSPAARAIGFLSAGGDMITSESLASAVAMDTAVLIRVSHDPAFRSRVNSAVMHVLTAKQAYGLLPCGAG